MIGYEFTAAASQSNFSLGISAPEFSQRKRKSSLIFPRKQQLVQKGTNHSQALFCMRGVP